MKTWSLALCKDHDPRLSAVKLPRGLTGRQQKFVLAWCGAANCNGVKAARLAGYTGNNATLAACASALLANPKIRGAINERFDDLAAPANEVIARLTTISRASIDDLIEFVDGKPFLKLTPENLQDYQIVIKEIETDPKTHGVLKVRLHDNLVALRELAKIRQLYHEGPEVNIYTHADQMTDAQLRAEIRRLMALEDEQLSRGRGREAPKAEEDQG